MSEKKHQLPEDIEERMEQGALWEREYWDDWVHAMIEVAGETWDEQMEQLRQMGSLGGAKPHEESK